MSKGCPDEHHLPTASDLARPCSPAGAQRSTPRTRPRATARCAAGETVGGGQDLRAALSGLVAGAPVPGYVRDQIEASWRRSLDWGLRPGTVQIPFDADYDADGPLIHAARPVLDQLALDVAGARVAVLLTDARGRIVDRRVPEPALAAYLDRVLLAPGHVYGEDVVGTNGMGTALAQRSPAAVGAE